MSKLLLDICRATVEKQAKRIEKLEAVRDAAKHVAYWLAKRGIANASSELKRLRAALNALE